MNGNGANETGARPLFFGFSTLPAAASGARFHFLRSSCFCFGGGGGNPTSLMFSGCRTGPSALGILRNLVPAGLGLGSSHIGQGKNNRGLQEKQENIFGFQDRLPSLRGRGVERE